MSEAEMTTHLQSEQIDKGLSRRGLVQALAAGAAAATVATPSLAEQTDGSGEATSADMPAIRRAGAALTSRRCSPGFKHLDMRTKGAVIRVRHGGSGPPLLLMHGYPNNHVLWYAVAAKLAERYHVVLADLRGYGELVRCQSPAPITSITASASWPRT